MTLPDWVTPDVMGKLQVLKDFAFQVKVVSTVMVLVSDHLVSMLLCSK